MTAAALPSGVDRDGFAILGRCAYLHSAVKGALHDDVRRALADYLDDWDRLGASWEPWLEAIEDCRAAFAELVGAAPADVFAAGSVSATLTAVLSALDLTERREILVFAEDFPTIVDVARSARERGATLRVLSAPEDGAQLLQLVEQAASERTCAVLVQWIHHVARYELDLAAFAERCHRAGALAIVDGYHGVGALAVDAPATGIDVLACGAMKYLLGGAGGLALAYCAPALSAAARPLVSGWLGSTDPFARDRLGLVPPAGARRFEAGLNSVADAFMLRAGLAHVTSWPATAASEHVRAQTAWLAGAVSELLGNRVRVAGPALAFSVADAPALVRELATRDVIAGSWGPWIRLSIHAYTTDDDVRAAASALRAIGASPALRPPG